jgi:hypothetical protein
MCPKAVSTTTPNRTAVSALRLGTRRGLRSSGWIRSLRLRFCISTNTYSRWLWFIDCGLAAAPASRNASGHDLAALIAMAGRPGGRPAAPWRSRSAGAVPQQGGHGCLLTSARHRQRRART